MPLRVFGIPSCDTVKKARAFLAERGAAHEFIDFKKAPPAADALARWADGVGLDALINRRGTTWRALDAATQAQAARRDGALALLAAQPSLIKRPLVEWPDGGTTVGFDADDWARRLG